MIIRYISIFYFISTFLLFAQNAYSETSHRLAMHGSPKYDKNFMDGFVCIGCFREQYEITNWSKLSSKEKAIIYQDITSRIVKYKEFQNSQQYKK